MTTPPTMMCVVDSDRRVQYANRAICELIGKSEESLKGNRTGEIIGCINALEDPRGCGRGRRCESCPLRLAIFDTFQTGTSHREINYRATVERGGDRHDVAFLGATALLHSDGDSSLLLCLEDITERKAHEREIERLNRLYAALSELNQSIVRVKSREELFREVCRIATEKAGFEVAWVGWPEPETHRVIPIVRDGDKQDYLDEVEVYADDRPEGRGPTGICIREGKLCVINDLVGDPRTVPWHAAAAVRGFQAIAALPICFHGQVWGVLTVYDSELNVFQDKEITLIGRSCSGHFLSLGEPGPRDAAQAGRGGVA